MHADARLTPQGRLTRCLRVEQGRPVSHVAREMGISRPTAHKWVRRFREEGLGGLCDRSSRPHRSPRRCAPDLEAQLSELRSTLKLGPARIGPRLGVPPSTVHRVLTRLGLNRLSWMDRPTGEVIRRYERASPGDLLHVDIKKLGRIPDGGGWRFKGRAPHRENGKGGRPVMGYAFLHAAVDDHSRLAYAEVHDDEKATTAAGFMRRATSFYAEHGIEVHQVLTDNGACYRSFAFRDALEGAAHLFTRPYRPQTNGKAERFNRTLLEEWAYVKPYDSELARTRALDGWLHLDNHHRHHTAIGCSPRERVNNLAGYYT